MALIAIIAVITAVVVIETYVIPFCFEAIRVCAEYIAWYILATAIMYLCNRNTGEKMKDFGFAVLALPFRLGLILLGKPEKKKKKDEED